MENLFATIINGFVDNILVGPLPIGMDGVEVDDSVAIGDLYSDGVFSRPDPDPPPGVVLPPPDPLAEYVAGMTDSAYRALPAAMKELLNQYRTVSPE